MRNAGSQEKTDTETQTLRKCSFRLYVRQSGAFCIDFFKDLVLVQMFLDQHV